MSDPEQLQIPPRKSALRFSLQTLLLFVLVAGLGFFHLITSWRLMETERQLDRVKEQAGNAERENGELHAQLGHLRVEDQSRLYAVASPFVSPDDERWRWEVYVPGQNYRLHATAGEEPIDYDSSWVNVQNYWLPAGKITIDAALRRDDPGPWKLEIKVRPINLGAVVIGNSEWSSVRRLALSQEQIDWIKRGGGTLLENTWNGSAAGNEPLVLLRGGPPIVELEEKGVRDAAPWKGLVLWIDDQESSPSSVRRPKRPGTSANAGAAAQQQE